MVFKRKNNISKVVDTTLIHQQHNLGVFLKNDVVDGDGDTVIQLGGSNPEEMAEAGGIVQDYANGRYAEMNINCGCPSPKVVGKCFGAKLMLDPPLVRELAYSLVRRVSVPVSIKCRIGADDHDSYEELCEFIDTVRSAGVRKFIIHARKCHLSGLNAKQNRHIPPLKYDVVHRLVGDFPELQFILNGGLQTFQDVDLHMGIPPDSANAENSRAELLYEQYGGTRVHGCMIGRAVYSNPFLFATADTKYFHAATDINPTRRQVLERYCDYCDSIMHENKSAVGTEGFVRATDLLGAAENIFVSCRNTSKYRKRLTELFVQEQKLRKDSSFVGGGEDGPHEISASRIVSILHLINYNWFLL
jgi:tRNA-dihydrouridine synthase A